MADVRLGVVVLNWERPQLTLRCLQSLAAAKPRPDRVVVVDNGSRDDSVLRIRQWAQDLGIAPSVQSTAAAYEFTDGWLTILRAPENRGFSTGNNHGLRFLREAGDVTHILLLNNDARVRDDTFAELRRALDRQPGAGILTGTIYVDRDDDEDEVWYAGGIEKPLRGLTAHITAPPVGDEIRSVAFVSGCAMLISREVLATVGLLPECYEPGYSEDAEYSRRTRLAGLPVLYAPAAVFYHAVGATAGMPADSEAVTYAQIRHRIFYIRRNFTGPVRVIALAYTVLTKPGRALIWIMRGRPRIALALMRGTVSGIVTRFTDNAVVHPRVTRPTE